MPLSNDKIQQLTRQLHPPKPKHDPTRHEMNPDVRVATENWMSPLNRVIWHKAFKSKATEVTIRDGRQFTIKYETRPIRKKSASDLADKIALAVINPAQGYGTVPCGEFRMKDVTDPSWVTDKS